MCTIYVCSEENTSATNTRREQYHGHTQRKRFQQKNEIFDEFGLRRPVVPKTFWPKKGTVISIVHGYTSTVEVYVSMHRAVKHQRRFCDTGYWCTPYPT